jgi:hypothetical protein
MRGTVRGLLGASAVAIALIAGGCGGSDTGPYLYRGDVGPLHLHGIAVAPDRQNMLAASHYGLYSGPLRGGESGRVGSGRDDLTALAVLPDDTLVASGHSNPLRKGPANLGLIASRDGKTWDSRSLEDEVYFTTLRTSGDALYGYDPATSRLFVSNDGGRTWPQRPRAPKSLYDLAVSPRDPLQLAAVNFRGVYRSADGGQSWRHQSVLAGLLAWPSAGDLTLLAANATYTHSAGAWRRIGPVPGYRPVALTAGPRGDIYAASHTGDFNFVSTDNGASWQAIP